MGKNWEKVEREVAEVEQGVFAILPDEGLPVGLTFIEPLPPNATDSELLPGQQKDVACVQTPLCRAV